ncbi:hypothetical protein ALC62_05045 [Cyphomyrmex costatus]|uniref:Uncharacterized protein n=1 Tax=Cyphomyrmex costatus TaxID=456900 RepID=A0A195CVU4_9HYME|nr:hypothetical protein ALC62_05045 [Cyphomyrmex costatus]
MVPTSKRRRAATSFPLLTPYRVESFLFRMLCALCCIRVNVPFPYTFLPDGLSRRGGAVPTRVQKITGKEIVEPGRFIPNVSSSAAFPDVTDPISCTPTAPSCS